MRQQTDLEETAFDVEVLGLCPGTRHLLVTTERSRLSLLGDAASRLVFVSPSEKLVVVQYKRTHAAHSSLNPGKPRIRKSPLAQPSDCEHCRCELI